MIPLCEMLASSAARARPKSVIFTRCVPAFEQHVPRLDVAVDQVGGVGGGQPLGDLPADPHDLGHVERPGPVEPLLEGLAGDELHHDVRQRLLADLVHLHHVLVPHLGRRPGLAQEPLAGRRGGGQLRGQHLHRDDPVEHVVERPEDDPEPALAEHLEHLVVPDPAERVGPGGRRQEPERHLVVGPSAPLLEGDRAGGRGVVVVRGDRRAIEEAVRLVVGAEQRLDPGPQLGIAAAGPVEVSGTARRVDHLSCGVEDFSFAHGRPPVVRCLISQCERGVRITQRNRWNLVQGRVQSPSRRAVTSQARA